MPLWDNWWAYCTCSRKLIFGSCLVGHCPSLNRFRSGGFQSTENQERSRRLDNRSFTVPSNKIDPCLMEAWSFFPNLAINSVLAMRVQCKNIELLNIRNLPRFSRYARNFIDTQSLGSRPSSFAAIKNLKELRNYIHLFQYKNK